MKKSKYKLIIFDCDGVLVDSESISCGMIAEELTKMGHPMTTEEGIETFGGTGMSYVIDYIEKKINGKIPFDFEARYRERTYELFQTELEPIAHIKETLEKIDVLKCVASNGPKDKMIMNLKITNLISFFPNRLFSAYDIQKWKPEPDLFLHAAKTMGIDPSDCMVVEDSPAGVQAAIAAGMKVYGYVPESPASKLEELGAELLHSMKDLPGIIYED